MRYFIRFIGGAIVTFSSFAFAATAAKSPAVASSPEQTVSARLPLKRVVLYKNGVGYFEHSGQVRGSEDIHIDFTTGQLNDALKSLTADFFVSK